MIRVYGREVGWSSFAVVAHGFRPGLEAHGALAGFVPVDTYDEYATYPGALAPGAVLCGPPSALPDLQRRGHHRYRALMLAPNSSWLPEGLMRAAREVCTEILTPSRWGSVQLACSMRPGFKAPVTVVPHGILPGFEGADSDGGAGRFRILHMTSSAFERKGTEALVEAFFAWPRRPDAELRIVAEPRAVDDLSQKVADRAEKAAGPSWVMVEGRKNFDPAQMGRLYRNHDLICQPSRAEGFGLVPLEARAAGVPVALTACTGHLEYLDSILDGATVAIETGPDGPIDEGEPSAGAMAPTVQVEAIMGALETSFTLSARMREIAAEAAVAIRERWAWDKVLAPWIDGLRERLEER